MALNFSEYFATNMRTGNGIKGTAREDFAFKKVLQFISDNYEDRDYIDCGVIWLEPDGESGDWAVWCNYEPDEEREDCIGGNDLDMIKKIKALIL